MFHGFTGMMIDRNSELSEHIRLKVVSEIENEKDPCCGNWQQL